MIPSQTIVVFRTGWGKYWPDRKQYLGSDAKGDISNLHFPGLSREAAELLVERNVAGVGIDTASMDYGPSTDFIVHQVLTARNIFGIENIASAERLPLTGGHSDRASYENRRRARADPPELWHSSRESTDRKQNARTHARRARRCPRTQASSAARAC